MASRLGIQRSNASGDLNDLVKEGRLEKIEGKPVLYKIVDEPIRRTMTLVHVPYWMILLVRIKV